MRKSFVWSGTVPGSTRTSTLQHHCFYLEMKGNDSGLHAQEFGRTTEDHSECSLTLATHTMLECCTSTSRGGVFFC